MREAQSWSGRPNGKLAHINIKCFNRSFVLQSIKINDEKWAPCVLEIIDNEPCVLSYSTSNSLREAMICAEELLGRFVKPASPAKRKSASA